MRGAALHRDPRHAGRHGLTHGLNRRARAVTAGLLGLSLGAGLVACDSEVPDPIVSVYPQELVLPPISYLDSTAPYESISVLNETYFPLTVRDIQLSGVGAVYLELERGRPQLDLALRESASVRLRIDPDREERFAWATGDYDAVLAFEVGGTGVTDPSSGEADPSGFRTLNYEIPISFRIDCDIDGDGFDSEECAGQDCRDDLNGTNPEAAEVCDGFDNDCDGQIDEGLTDCNDF